MRSKADTRSQAVGRAAFSRRIRWTVATALVLVPALGLTGCLDVWYLLAVSKLHEPPGPVDAPSISHVPPPMNELEERIWGEAAESRAGGVTVVPLSGRSRAYLDSVLDSLVSARGGYPVGFEISVMIAGMDNAFAYPDGQLYITAQMVGSLESEDELAGLLGHEVAHVVQRHIYRQIKAQEDAGFPFASFVLSGAAGAAMAHAKDVAESFKYARVLEIEADALGVVLLTSAGYSPEAVVEYWRAEAEEGEEASDAQSTHPPDAERLVRLEELLPYLDRGEQRETDKEAFRNFQLDVSKRSEVITALEATPDTKKSRRVGPSRRR